MKKTLRSGLLVVLGATSMEAGTFPFELTPKGRLHVDYAAHDDDLEPLEDGFLARRVRLGLEAKFGDDWSSELEYDFADLANGDDFKFIEGANVKDVYLRYGGWKEGSFTLGQFKVPFGLEELTSSNNITFIERALPIDTFALSRRLGLGFERGGSKYTVAAMGFGSAIGGEEGPGAGARFTFTPIDADDTVVHLGLATTIEWPEGEISFRTFPESRPADVRLVNTRALEEVSRLNKLGLEAAWKRGPFSAQTELMHSHVSREAGLSDAALFGWYVAGSWVLTGESRGYGDGGFKGISPSKRGGAWELTARYSHVDLDDGGVRGGQEDNFTLGLNWYANKHLRIMTNYIKVFSERRGDSDDPHILLVRAQITF